MNWTGPLVPHAREKAICCLHATSWKHACFHSRIRAQRFDNSAAQKELLRFFGFGSQAEAVVLVLKILRAEARFARGRPAPWRFGKISAGGLFCSFEKPRRWLISTPGPESAARAGAGVTRKACAI
jgi:hypothetical protein